MKQDPKMVIKSNGDQSVRLQVSDKNIFKKVTGFHDTNVAAHMLTKVSSFYSLDESKKEQCVELALKSLMELESKDGVAGMLSAQMLLTHDLAMTLLQKAKGSKYMDELERYTNCATKLLRTFTSQTVAMDYHKRDHGPKVEVQNVNVNEGGQAIVGNLHRSSK